MQKILKQIVGIDVAKKELVVSLGCMHEDFALKIHIYKAFYNTTKPDG